MKIICEKNKGYRWFERKGIHFRGYLQKKDMTYIAGEEALFFLESVNSYEELKELLKNLYGCYAIIMEYKEEKWLAVDVARSMPLYYDSHLSVISDSAEAIRRELSIPSSQVDAIRTLEFYATSYIVGDNTIFSDIKQLDLGMLARIVNNCIFTEYYYIHNNNIKNYTRKAALTDLSKRTNEAINRIKKAVGNRQIVISLSGGYDSRYLACSLRDNGIQNVICYTYGGQNSFETIQSKKVAEALGFKWYSINYDDNNVLKIASQNMFEYFDYAKNYDYISYIQNYIAFESLSMSGIIEPDAVVLTGLCNDMPTGYYTPSKDEISKYKLDIHGCAEFVYDQRFIKFQLKDSVKQKLVLEIEKDLIEWKCEVFDYESFVHASDCANTAYSHSRCFLHMNNVHEFFNHEWMLLCWDKDLLDFWYSLPTDYRFHQNLYEEYITEIIGKKYGVGTKKTVPTVGKTKYMQRLIRELGSIVVKLSYTCGKPIRRRTDINNFAPLEVALYHKIKEKKAIKNKYAAITLLLTVYTLELRHGTEWYNIIEKMIRN